MTEDLVDLMLRPRARKSDPVTSHEAGEHSHSFSSSDRDDIYGVLAAGRAMAAEEISDHLGWNDHVRVNRRLKELADPVLDEYGALVRPALIERTEERHLNRSRRFAFRYRAIRACVSTTTGGTSTHE